MLEILGSEEFWEIASRVSTTVAALAALAAAIIAVFQLRQARKTRLERAKPHVVAVPDPDRSHGRDCVLLIKNYGPTTATDLRIVSGIVVNQPVPGGFDGGFELQLQTNVLAPGQQIAQHLNDVSVDDPDDWEMPISVSFRDWRGEKHELSYGVRRRTLAFTGSEDMLRAVSEKLTDLTEVLRGWGAADKRALRVESRQPPPGFFEHPADWPIPEPPEADGRREG